MDQYPSKAELNELKILADAEDTKELLSFIEQLWWMSDWGFVLKGKRVLRLELHTGGWSGNEDIIGVLRGSMFWFFWWQKSVRGGHYYFKIKSAKHKGG